MKRKGVVLYVLLSVLLLAAIGTVAYTSGTLQKLFGSPKETQFVPESSEPSDQAEELELPKKYSDLFDRCYAKATPAQKDQLEELLQSEILYYSPKDHIKQVLIIMGELPADTPRITLEQALAIFDEMREQAREDPSIAAEFEWELIRRFNEIAGAPDFSGGSGMVRTTYCLTDDQTEYLQFTDYRVFYGNDNTGELEYLLYCSELQS